jgi:hypothetical protein
MKKAIKSDPGGKTLRFLSGALPHSGSESGLMALIFCLVSTPSERIVNTQTQRLSILRTKKDPTQGPGQINLLKENAP